MQTIKNATQNAVTKFVSAYSGECVDIVVGSLIDNMVYEFDFGTLFCFEQYTSEWSSNYTMYFFHKGRERGINKMWERFYALRKNSSERV